jgi:hypothetical protein
MPDAARVSAGVFRALRPGGRFVAEAGGFGCVAAVRVALADAMERAGVDATGAHPWYFPTAEHHRAVLERAGFVVDEIVVVARPTVVPAGFGAWLETFAKAQLARVPAEQRAACVAVGHPAPREPRCATSRAVTWRTTRACASIARRPAQA